MGQQRDQCARFWSLLEVNMTITRDAQMDGCCMPIPRVLGAVDLQQKTTICPHFHVRQATSALTSPSCAHQL